MLKAQLGWALRKGGHHLVNGQLARHQTAAANAATVTAAARATDTTARGGARHLQPKLTRGIAFEMALRQYLLCQVRHARAYRIPCRLLKATAALEEEDTRLLPLVVGANT